MAAFICACIVTIGSSAPSVPDPPLSWNASGEWVAFTVATPPVEELLAGFPLLPPAGEGLEDSIGTSGDASSVLTYCVWAVRVSDFKAMKIAEGPGSMTSPAWGPDGRSLAFARIVPPEGEDLGAWEVVVGYGTELEVLVRRPMGRGTDRGEELLGDAVAWEPSGRILAVPDPEGAAIDLIETRGGGTLRRIERARLASFSPMGGRFSFYRDRGERWELVEGRTDSGPEGDRPIDLVDDPTQAPLWTADGQAILYLKQGPPTADGIQTKLFCYRLGEDKPSEIKEVEAPSMPGEELLGAYMTVAADGFDQYYAIQFSGRNAALAYHRGSHPMDRPHPFAGFGQLGAINLSPGGDRIAVRFGGPGPRAVPGLIDIETKTMTPLAPDDELRAAWIAALGEAASLPTSPQERPTRLPFATELAKGGQTSPSYKRLAELGGRLTEELVGSGGRRSQAARPALVFAYLQGDYAGAEHALEDLEAIPRTSDESLRLLGLRAQLRLARGENAQAREMIEFLRDQNRNRVARIESDGSGGFAVNRDLPEMTWWTETLWKLHRDRLDSAPDVGSAAIPEEPATPPSPFEFPISPGTISP